MNSVEVVGLVVVDVVVVVVKGTKSSRKTSLNASMSRQNASCSTSPDTFVLPELVKVERRVS